MDQEVVQILIRPSKAEKSSWDEFSRLQRWTMNTLIRTATNQYINHSKVDPSMTDPTKSDAVLECLSRIERKLDSQNRGSPTISGLLGPSTPKPSDPFADNSTLVNAIVNEIRDSRSRERLVKCNTLDELVVALEELNSGLRLPSGSDPINPIDEALAILRKEKIVKCDKGGFLKWNMSKSLAEFVLTN